MGDLVYLAGWGKQAQTDRKFTFKKKNVAFKNLFNELKYLDVEYLSQYLRKIETTAIGKPQCQSLYGNEIVTDL